jgi:hypothetical protein
MFRDTRRPSTATENGTRHFECRRHKKNQERLKIFFAAYMSARERKKKKSYAYLNFFFIPSRTRASVFASAFAEKSHLRHTDFRVSVQLVTMRHSLSLSLSLSLSHNISHNTGHSRLDRLLSLSVRSPSCALRVCTFVVRSTFALARQTTFSAKTATSQRRWCRYKSAQFDAYYRFCDHA